MEKYDNFDEKSKTKKKSCGKRVVRDIRYIRETVEAKIIKISKSFSCSCSCLMHKNDHNISSFARQNKLIFRVEFRVICSQNKGILL